MIGDVADRVRSLFPGGPPTASLDEDVVFDMLANERRRHTLRIIEEIDDGNGVDVTELAEHIAAVQSDVDVEDLTDQQYKRVYVSLYQTHLPKMDSAGLVEHDKDAGIVRTTDETAAAVSTLAEVDTRIEREVIA